MNFLIQSTTLKYKINHKIALCLKELYPEGKFGVIISSHGNKKKFLEDPNEIKYEFVYDISDIKIDDEYDMNKSNILEKGLFAKFSQNVSLKNLLLETKDAKIVHYKRGGDAIILTELMRVREKLNK